MAQTTIRDGKHWLVGEMLVPDWVTKLKRIGKQDLVLLPEAASVSRAAGDGAAAGRPVWWRVQHSG
jgi:hypothetical protein